VRRVPESTELIREKLKRIQRGERLPATGKTYAESVRELKAATR
jgi:hypothetical protein